MLIVNVFRSYSSWSLYLNNSIDQMIIIGTKSIPIVILTSFFTGMVASVQASYQMESSIILAFCTARPPFSDVFWRLQFIFC